MSRGRVDTFKVPDGLGCFAVHLLGEQASSVVQLEDSGVTPGLVRKRGDVEDVDDERISWLSAFDGKGTCESENRGPSALVFVSAWGGMVRTS